MRVVRLEASEPGRIAEVYRGASPTFQLLRCFGWGGLLNLGWFSWPVPLSWLNLVFSKGFLAPSSFLQFVQERLLRRALSQLAAKSGDLVVDVGCGRGRSSFVLAHSVPGTQVIGLDLDRASIECARVLHGRGRASAGFVGPHFVVGDAMELPFQVGSVDRVLALECAFHFPDRRKFVHECARVLKPAGRVVIVDFVWQDQLARNAAATPEIDLVRDVWQLTDFSTTAEYEEAMQSAGLDVVVEDWSRHVSMPLASVFVMLTRLASSQTGRRLLGWYHPLLRSFDAQDWVELSRSAHAHLEASRLSRYVALVGTKRAAAMS